MRVTDKLRYDIFNKNILALREEIDKTQTMIASQKKILKPSDDPVTSSVANVFEVEKGINEQYKKNLERLHTVCCYYDTSINNIHDLLTKAKEICITQASDTMDASTRLSASEEIKGIIEQLVTIGNTKVGNVYIFSGKTTDVVPFSMDDDYNVTFNGSSEVMEVYVDKKITENAGISGEQIFISGTNIFERLKDLKEALEGNDVEGIKEAINNISNCLDKTETNIAYTGTFYNKVDRLIETMDTRNNNITITLSDMLDVDIEKVVSDFNILSTAYQALLYSMSKMQELSVLNYL